MGLLDFYLPVALYIAIIVLVIVLIVLVVRLIQVLNKAEILVEDVEKKVKSLDGIFSIIDKATDSVTVMTDKLIGTLVGKVGHIFKKKKNDKEEEDYYE